MQEVLLSVDMLQPPLLLSAVQGVDWKRGRSQLWACGPAENHMILTVKKFSLKHRERWDEAGTEVWQLYLSASLAALPQCEEEGEEEGEEEEEVAFLLSFSSASADPDVFLCGSSDCVIWEEQILLIMSPLPTYSSSYFDSSAHTEVHDHFIYFNIYKF